MDTAPSSFPTPPMTSNAPPKLLILGLFSTFFLGVIIGFYVVFPLLTNKIRINPSVVTQPNNNLGLPPQVFEYLENPLLTNWSIRIVGKVVDKSDNYLIVGKDGDQIKMIVDNETEFKTVSSSLSSTKPLSFQEVKIGDSIQGSATVEYINREVKIKGLVLGIGQ